MGRGIFARLIIVLWMAIGMSGEHGFGVAPQTQLAKLRIAGIPAAMWLNVDKPLSVEVFRGRLWVLGILEPWSFRSREAALGVSEVYKKWSRRGVGAVLLTVEPVDAVRPILQSICPTVPVGCESPLPMLLPLEPLPQLYLIGPEEIAVWSGPADSLADVLPSYYRKLTPDGLSVYRAAELESLLDEARSALDQEDYFRGLGLAQAVSRRTPASHRLHADATKLLERLDDLAEAMLIEADRLLQQGKTVKAYDVLLGVTEQFYGTELGSRAMAELRDLKNDEAAFRAVLLARDESSADRLLELARRAVSKGRYSDAERYYRLILDLYGHTEVASAARTCLDALVNNASAASNLAAQRAWPDAQVLVSLARRYAELERFDEARRCYRQVIQRFAKTPFATRARRALATLPSTSVATQPP